MITTQDSSRAERLRILRNHGAEPKYYHRWIGGNFRLDALQAAVVLVKLRYLDDWTERRQRNAKRYDRLFQEFPLSHVANHANERSAADAGSTSSGTVQIPHAIAGRHVYNQYVIRVPRRDELKEYLKDQGVATEIYYPVPLHLQACFPGLGYQKGDYPESERAAVEALALPVFPELTDEQARYVVTSIAEFFMRDGAS